jgi:hypothetical protein
MLVPLRIPFKLAVTPVRLQHHAAEHPNTAMSPTRRNDDRWNSVMDDEVNVQNP